MSHAATLPPNLARLSIGGKTFDFWLIQGTGLAENVWAETNISSSQNGYGQVASVHSTNTTKREFWMRLADGKETKISLPDNTSFAVREGHHLSLICMRSNFLSTDSFYYMGVVNHATDKGARLDNSWMIRKFAGTERSQGTLNVFVLFTLGLGLIPIALYGQWITKRYENPLHQRLRDIASFCVQHGTQASPC